MVVEGGPLVDGRSVAGIGRYADRLTAALVRRDDVDVVVSRPGRPPRSEQHALRALHAQPALFRAIRRHRPAVVHALAAEPAFGFPLRRQVVTVHDVVPWTWPGYLRRPQTAAWFRLVRARLRRCGALITVSQVAAREIVDVLGIAPGVLTVVPEGVDDVFTAVRDDGDGDARAAARVGDGLPYVLWVGTMRVVDRRKGLDTLLEAVARAGPAGGQAPRLVLAGATGPGSQRMAELAHQAGVELVLPGYVPDATLAALMRGAGAVAMPSLHEGFGLPALEAMACGAPLVVSAAGNLPDLVAGTALVVAPGDAAALAQALRQLLSRDEYVSSLTARAAERARSFSWANAAEQTVGVYRRLAGACR